MARTPEAVYQELGQLITQRPGLEGRGDYAVEQHQWLGRTSALMEEIADGRDLVDLRIAVGNLGIPLTRASGVTALMVLLYKYLARAEAAAPPEMQGAFIDVGHALTALQAVSKVFGQARNDLLIVDPYMSLSALFDFVTTAPNGISIRVLCDSQNQNLNADLRNGVARWKQQFGAGRPIEARASQPRALHDRLLIIDGNEAWNLSQSLKDLAGRSPASLVRFDPEVSAMKVAAYDAIWAAAMPP